MMHSTMSRKKSYFLQTTTCLILLCIWQILSLFYPSILIPSPYETSLALVQLTTSGALSEQFLTSGARMLIGFTIGGLIATTCGLLAGKSATLFEMFKPIVSFLLGIPPIILVVVAMVWFGTSSFIPILVVAILVFPTFFLNVANGYRQIDSQLLEMATIYKKSKRDQLKKIILPSLMIPLFTAISLAAGGSVRITIMAELLGANDGIGAALSLARINIDTAKVFAWTFISIVTIIIIDFCFINPLKKRVLRYQEEPYATRYRTK